MDVSTDRTYCDIVINAITTVLFLSRTQGARSVQQLIQFGASLACVITHVASLDAKQLAKH